MWRSCSPKEVGDDKAWQLTRELHLAAEAVIRMFDMDQLL